MLKTTWVRDEKKKISQLKKKYQHYKKHRNIPILSPFGKKNVISATSQFTFKYREQGCAFGLNFDHVT